MNATTPRARPPARSLLLVGLLGALLFLPGLGSRDLWNPDEPRYAEVAREMLAAGDFLVPHFNGEVYTQKPPLQFWAMAAASLATGGLDERAARLPAALAAIGLLLLTFSLGRWLFGTGAAWIAVAALGTGVKVLWQGRIGQIDMLLTFLVTLAVWCWVRGESEGKPAFHRLFFVAAGLATLAKGPAGLLPPLLAILAFYLLTRDRSGLRRLRPGLGLALWALVVLAWLVPAGLAAGREYLDQILFRQNLTRYANPWHHRQPWYYFLTVIPADFFPWSFLLPGALAVGWRRILGGRRGIASLAEGAGTAEPGRPAGADGRAGSAAPGPALSGADGRASSTVPGEADTAANAGVGQAAAGRDQAVARWGFLFCLCWMLVTVAFFSLSPAKRTVYVLTMYPAMALLVGAGIEVLAAGWPRQRRWLVLPLGLLAGLLALLAAALGAAAWHLARGTELGVRLASRAPELALLRRSLPSELAAWVGLAAAGAVAAAWLAGRGRPRPAVGALAAGSAASALGLVLGVLPAVNPVKSARPIAEELLAASAPGDPYAVFPRLDAPVIFYTRRFAHWPQSAEELRAFAARPGPAWVFIECDDLAKLDPPLPLVEVARSADPRNGYVLLGKAPAP